MAQCLGALAVLAEDWVQFPEPTRWAHDHLQLQFRKILHPLLTLTGMRHTYVVHEYVQEKYPDTLVVWMKMASLGS